MKVLSVRQPWCWLLFNGKDIENRTWRTSYRGPLLIHASLGKDPEDFMPRQREYIESAGIVIPEDLPRGAIVGSVNLSGVAEAGDTTSPWFEGPYGFLMTDPVEFKDPIQCRGQLGIRDVSDSLMARVSKMLIK